nr:cell division protein FtsB [Halopseudomonas xinjiangensis]
MDVVKWLWIAALVLLAGLQYRLWVGEGSFAHVAQLKQQIAQQQQENEQLLERNRVLTAEVLELKQGLETIEERARHELGMVREGETLFQLSNE